MSKRETLARGLSNQKNGIAINHDEECTTVAIHEEKHQELSSGHTKFAHIAIGYTGLEFGGEIQTRGRN